MKVMKKSSTSKSQSKTEIALQECERKFRETVKHLGGGYYSVTDDGLSLEHNQAFNQILGIDIDQDMKGAKLPDFWLNPDDRKVYLDELITSGFIRNYLINAKKINDEKIVVMANSHMVKDEQGGLLRIEGTFTDFTKIKRVEEQIRERMKELQALYSLSEITEREGITLDKLYQELANILPISWLYAEIACARIVIGESEFHTNNFTESKWMQSAPVKVSETVVGRIDVGYLEERPEQDEGPFLKEERWLINAISERLDTQHEITRFNRALELLTGRTEKDVIGKSLEILFPPALRDSSMELIKKTLEGERWKAVEILLVEDNPNDAELTIIALKKNNLANNVIRVCNGEEALDFIFARGMFKDRKKENAPKVILLDLKLPKVDGLEVLRIIKADPVTKIIPVVVLTSSKEENDMIESYRLGVNSYIVKPVDFDKFSDSVGDIGLYWLLLNEQPDIKNLLK
jgi:PAS domain S-box-containing protein